jgi:hypothetical protein
MNRKIVSLKAFCFVTLVCMLCMSGPAATGAEPAFQKLPITLQASRFLPKELLKGPHFKVDEVVTNDGFINIYKLSTDYGNLRVKSTALLKIRINEVHALSHMEEVKKTKVFTDAVKKGVLAPVRTVKGLVTEPIDTVSEIGTGIGRWFSDVGHSIVSKDSDQENVLKTAIGKASAKRKFAYEYGVNPYTSWEPVQKNLDSFAWTTVAGGLMPKIAFGLIKKPVGTALKVTGSAHGMKQLVSDKSPAQLEKINRKKLEDLGTSEHIIDSFIANPNYNPQESTLLVGALETLKSAIRVSVFMEDAALADSPSVSRYLRLQAQMMELFAAKFKQIEQLIDCDGMIFVKRSNGVAAGFLPMDYLAWTAKLSNRERVASEGLKNIGNIKSKELWVDGWVDIEARKALEGRGWIVVEQASETLMKK